MIEEVNAWDQKNKEESAQAEESLLLKIEELKKRISDLERENDVLKNVIENELIHDHLTGAKNRNYFEARAQEIISSLERLEGEIRKEGYKNFSILLADIDNFKKINDEFGHNVGDSALKKVSDIMTANVRGSDIVSRWGGEEFVIGLPGADEEEAFEIAEKIREAVANNRDGVKVTLSIGVACHTPEINFKSFIENADSAMYHAKETGKNKTVKYTEIADLMPDK